MSVLSSCTVGDAALAAFNDGLEEAGKEWGVGKGGRFSDGFGVWLQGLPRAGDGVLEKRSPGGDRGHRKIGLQDLGVGGGGRWFRLNQGFHTHPNLVFSFSGENKLLGVAREAALPLLGEVIGSRT